MHLFCIGLNINCFAPGDSTAILCCGQRVTFTLKEFFHQVSREKDFFTMSILPELLGKFYSRKDEPKATSNTAQDPCCSVTSGDVTDGEGGSSEPSKMKLYCYCQVPDGDDMVGCDNRACEREWFHLKCLKLKDFPCKKYWYYPNCRKLPQFKPKGKKIECN